MLPHDVCAVRAVIFLVGSFHISWATFICIHSWICGSLSWRAIHHNYRQGLFLRISSLPSRLLSRISGPVFWGDVVHADFWHIWFRNHPLSRQIGWGTIYGVRDPVFWKTRSILPSQVVYAASHWIACLTAVIHSIHGESQNKSIHSGPIVWDCIPKWIPGEFLRVLCSHTQVDPLGFGGKSCLRQIRQSTNCDETGHY